MEGWIQAKRLTCDWVVIDAEHGHLDWKEVLEHVRAAVRSDTVALVRIAELNLGLIKRALDIDANSATAYLFLALLKSAQGDLDEGVKKIKRAEKLDPYSPSIISFAVGIYGAAGRFDDGIAAGKRMVQLDPSYIYFEPALAEAYRAKGDLPAATAIYEKAQEQTHSPSGGLGAVGWCL